MKIRIAPEFKTQMAEEFKTSKQNVMMALKGYNQSELAKKVRARAKVLLQEEANNIIMIALDYYYDDAVCTAETVEEMNQFLNEKL